MSSSDAMFERLAHLHTGNTQKKVSNIASDKDIMEIIIHVCYVMEFKRH